MNNTTIAALFVCLSGSVASAGIDLIEVLPGYSLGGLYGTSADGSTLAADLFVRDALRYDAYAWSNGAWSSLPRDNDFNLWQGISGDGRTTLSVSSLSGTQSQLVRVQDGVRDVVTFGLDNHPVMGALTRDGQTVFYSSGSSATAPIGLYQYAANTLGGGTRIATLSERYIRSDGLLAGHRDDLFVLNTEIEETSDGVGGLTRAVVYDNGRLTEIGTLGDEPILHSRATDMTADGSTIVGWELSRDGTTSETSNRSWMYRDSTLSEIRFDGFDQLTIQSITDDASAMVGGARNDAGDFGSYLFYADGRSYAAAELLAREGVFLGEGESASLADISANGAVVSGAIYRNEFNDFGPRYTLFTITVPAPSSALALLGLGLMARRRR